MRRVFFASAVLVCAKFATPAQEPEPCTVGFDYTISTDAASPGQSFYLYGNWGPEQLDRAPDFVTGGEMHGGRRRLEVIEWTAGRVQVRIGPWVRPGLYSLSMFCGERLRNISPFKTLTVLQPNPRFDYTLSPSPVRAGETLELNGDWKLLMDRTPILFYSKGQKQLELEVVDWKDDVVQVRIPVFVNGKELVPGDALQAEIYVDSEKLYLVAGYKELEILHPTEEVLHRARVEEGLVAPWIGEAPRNLAIVAGAAFLLGATIFGIGGMLAATADFALAGFFLIVWVWPYTFGRLPYSELSLLFMMEFIVIHASAFLAGLSMLKTTARNKIAIVGGCCGFYTLFVWGYSHANDTMWPLVFFWTLMTTKLIPLFTRYARDWTRSMILARATVGTLAYLLAVFAGAFLPLPRFGWPADLSMGSGMAEAEPYRVMFMGTVYFGLMGIYEGLLAKLTKEPLAQTD